jgi:hypothetical protein
MPRPRNSSQHCPYEQAEPLRLRLGVKGKPLANLANALLADISLAANRDGIMPSWQKRGSLWRAI